MKSAVTYLTYSQDAKKLNQSIELVRKNMRDRDIIVFHEKEDDILPNLVKHDNIRYVELEFSVPSFLPADRIKPLYYQATMGYRHMCRFWAKEFLTHPVICEYDYILRLDSDSYITDKVANDPIDHCANNKIYYGYLAIMEDVPYYTTGLKDAALKYSVMQGLVHPEVMIYANQYYYTNFEVVNIEKLYNPIYQDFTEYLDATGGIYFFRWGDHVIRYLGTKLSMPERFVKQLKVPYQHQEYICKE
jgi:hypothetical protein